MSVVSTAIKAIGVEIDVLGPQLGLSESTIEQVDVGLSGLAGAADNANVLVVVGAAAVGGLVVAAIGPEALVAGVAGIIGEDALVGASVLADSILETNLPAALAYTSGEQIVNSTVAAAAGYLVGDQVSEAVEQGVTELMNSGSGEDRSGGPQVIIGPITVGTPDSNGATSENPQGPSYSIPEYQDLATAAASMAGRAGAIRLI